MQYDVVIVGAGPTGLLAARDLALKGRKVIVIERKQDVSSVRRACCAQLIMDDGYENEALQVEGSKITFPRNGFAVTHAGPTLNITSKYFHSPRGNKIHFSHQDGRPLAIKFSKEQLLKGLARECEQAGVDFMLGAVVYHAKDTQNGVAFMVTHGTVKLTVTGQKAIVAEGVNAHVTGALGFNKGRQHYVTALCEKYILDNVSDYEPLSWNFYYGRTFFSNAAIIIGPSFYGERAIEMTVLGSKQKPPSGIFENVTTRSPLKHMFEKAKLIDKHGCSIKALAPLREPSRGNVLIAGDAAAYIEVEVQGGLMCGHHAAIATDQELQGVNGYAAYTKWWQESFEFLGDDFMKVAQGYALVPGYSDDELDYLFSLTQDEVLEGTYSQYKTPKLMWASILRHKEVIDREQPELADKINKINQMSLDATF